MTLSFSLVWYSFTYFLMNYIRAPFYFHYKLGVYWIYRLPIVPWSESADILLKQTTTRATFHHQRCPVCPLLICHPAQKQPNETRQSLSEPKHLSFHHHPVASQQQAFPLWGHLTLPKSPEKHMAPTQIFHVSSHLCIFLPRLATFLGKKYIQVMWCYIVKNCITHCGKIFFC